MPAFCEARYFGWSALDENKDIPVKGKYMTAHSLTMDAWKEGNFTDGSRR